MMSLRRQKGEALAGALLLGAVLTMGGMKVGAPHMMMHESESPYDFNKTVEVISENAKQQGWKVPKVYDFQETIRKDGGMDVGPMKVVELCHPKLAAEMLKSDENKVMSVMMPCAVGVYQKSDGKTYVSSMNMKVMSMVFSGNASEILSRVAEEDQKILGFLKSE
jgi:uncharacterized protein (DUF302 family)